MGAGRIKLKSISFLAQQHRKEKVLAGLYHIMLI